MKVNIPVCPFLPGQRPLILKTQVRHQLPQQVFPDCPPGWAERPLLFLCCSTSYLTLELWVVPPTNL